MEIEKKIPIHLGLFGHIDCGKTAIAAVLSEFISTAGIDAHPQSKERGITIDLGFTSFILDNYLVTLVDGPGHADLIKISASSIEIIDCALLVIDINKGPQVQTGEHLIMIEALNIKKIIVILNKIDLFKRPLDEEIKKIKKFFESTSFGANIPIYTVSAKNKEGFEKLKNGILKTIETLDIKRDLEGDLVIPIDHHFSIKGMGAVITGTILKGKLTLNQFLELLPVNTSGRVKNIQVFHQNVESAKAGDRVGINVKNIDINKVYRGCYATNNKNAFEYCDIIEVKVNNNNLFKPETRFGTQVHVTIGMVTVVGNIYPYYELEGKRVKTTASSNNKGFKAILWLKERVLIRKEKAIMLISRLDLPPTTLRIIGSAEIIKIHTEPPLFYKYKIKKGRIQNPNHPQGIVCEGLAKSVVGAKKIIGKKLEAPFTKILSTFGTKGAVIVGIESKEIILKKSEPVLKELRSFHLKKI
ncbi:MAG: selenocysteine-specific translation elongation factor [Promethearchaeota archaeon]|nr:MAG: selenocysteine-specific translation elongation factor [Candidatus Lokiarchaeota archaeon]